MEIEVRVFIDDINDFENKVKKVKAVFLERKHIIDYWFCLKSAKTFKDIKQKLPGSYGLRIRKSIYDNKETIELNCKVLEKEEDHNAFHEHETKVENFEETKNILESIGFKIFCMIDKKRITYRLDNCLINIEDINRYKPAVELEIISDKNEEIHKKNIKKILKKLGIKKLIDKSITYYYMKEFSFKQV